MKDKLTLLATSVAIALTGFCAFVTIAQSPVKKPQRPTTSQQAQKTHQSHSREQVISGTINGHDYVDLGLPSGTKWATCNLGAGTPSDYGGYYSWGDTSTKSSYTTANCRLRGLTSSELQKRNVIDSKGNLMPKYDAAKQNWGVPWRMPTFDEIRELNDRCTWIWTSEGRRNGYRVRGPNGNSIFLPAAGIRIRSALDSAGSYGGCWSATVDSSAYTAYALTFDSSTPHKDSYTYDWGAYSRYYGQSIRPVIE